MVTSLKCFSAAGTNFSNDDLRHDILYITSGLLQVHLSCLVLPFCLFLQVHLPPQFSRSISPCQSQPLTLSIPDLQSHFSIFCARFLLPIITQQCHALRGWRCRKLEADWLREQCTFTDNLAKQRLTEQTRQNRPW